MLSDNYIKILEFVDAYGGISIEIAANLFYQSKYGYDNARRALKKIKDTGYLKTKNDFLTGKLVYYNKKSISSHRLLLLLVYSKLVFYGAEILSFTQEYKTGIGNCDGLIVYKLNDIIKVLAIEIDINNKTKLEKYDRIYESRHFQSKIKTFPKVIIVDDRAEKRRNKTKTKYNYEVNYVDYDMNDLFLFI